MNQLWNLNSTIVKEVNYNASLQPSATTLNFTIENCHVNARIEKIVFYLKSADANFGAQILISLLDRGNGYTLPINGFDPVTFATIGSSVTASGGTSVSPVITQALNSTTVVAEVNQSVQDSEGVGNIYIKLERFIGTFSTSFTMAVFYKPEITFNSKLNTRWQQSDCSPARVLSQTGTGTYLVSTMTDQTNFVARNVNPRNNVDVVNFGFSISSSNPVFYFGTPFKVDRWFLGFSSDNTPSIGLVTFSYFDGTNFVGLLTTEVANGCVGPGTYRFANDGVVIFTPPANWTPVQMSKDPLTIYNTTMIGLGTLATNNTVNNPPMYWIQCQVGFTTTANDLKISTVVPLIEPDQPLTYRRKLI